MHFSPLFVWLIERITDLWNSSAGSIFLLTIIGYFIACVSYSGYLAWFMGGTGSVSLIFTDFNPVDILTLLPVGITTLLEVFWNLIRESAKEVLKIFTLWLVVPFILVVLLRSFVLPLLSVARFESQFVATCSQYLWLAGVTIGLFISGIENRRKRWLWMVVSLFLQIGGLITLILSMPHDSAASTTASEMGWFMKRLFDFLMMMNLVLVIFFLFFLGYRLAERSAHKGLLSCVSKIYLKQPLSGLGDIEMLPEYTSRDRFEFKKLWFARKSIPIEFPPDTYVCTPLPESMYLIAAFRKNIAFYLMNPAEPKIQGEMVLIANDLIYGIRFKKYERKEDDGT